MIRHAAPPAHPGRRALLCVLAGLGACAEQVPGPLAYQPGPSAPARAARPSVALGEVTDFRRDGAEDADWIGAIRGNVGNRLAVIRTEGPVRDAVARALSDALAARGLLAPTGAARRMLGVTILRLDAAQFVRREATVELAATLSDTATGETLWRGTGTATLVEGSLSGAERAGTAAELRGIAARAMSEAIGYILDDAAFRAAAAATARRPPSARR